VSFSLLNANILSSLFYIVVAILVLMLMVTIHELGHYLVARKLGFKINEFAIGFGKILWSKINKRGEKISIRLFPLGGMCVFEGEDEELKNNPLAFNNQKPWKRLLVQFAGGFFNIVSALIFAFIFLVSYGYDIMRVSAVPVDSQNYGVIQTGDIVYKVNGTDIYFANDNRLSDLLSRATHDETTEVILTIKRDGEFIEVPVLFKAVISTVEGVSTTSYMLNISFENYPQPFFEALGNTIPFVFGWAWVILKFFWLLITFRVSLTEVGGPISTIGMIADVSSKSFANFMLLLPLIAINLGVFNLIPFPALDGMRMLFTEIEWVRGKPLNRNVEAYIHFGGFVFLIIFVFAVDIIKLFV